MLLQLIVPRMYNDLVLGDVTQVRIGCSGARATLLASLSISSSARDTRNVTCVHNRFNGRNKLSCRNIRGVVCEPPARLAAPTRATLKIHAPPLYWEEEYVFTLSADAIGAYFIPTVLLGREIIAEQLAVTIQGRVSRPADNCAGIASISWRGPNNIDAAYLNVRGAGAETLNPHLTIYFAFDRLEMAVDKTVPARHEIAFLAA
ncbi:MAG: hypothetical protein K2X31_08945, partial [Sphingopyxis sp.]|nr:hypothetical protein [Sphingopyxis sp.]